MKIVVCLAAVFSLFFLSACSGGGKPDLVEDSGEEISQGPTTGPTTPEVSPTVPKDSPGKKPEAEEGPKKKSSSKSVVKNPEATRAFEKNLRAFYGKKGASWCSTYSKSALENIKKSTGLSCRKYIQRSFPRQELIGLETAIYETSENEAMAVGVLCLQVSDKIAKKLNLSSNKIPSGSVWGNLSLSEGRWKITSPPSEIFSGFDSGEQGIISRIEKKLKKNTDCDWDRQSWTPASSF